MTENELFTKTYNKRNKYLVRVTELEGVMIDESDEDRLGEIVVLIDHYKSKIQTLNNEIVDMLSEPSEKKSLKKMFNLGIGKR